MAKIKIKNSLLPSLLKALSLLDGIDVKVGENVIKKPFELAGNIRWNIVKNLRIVNTAAEDLEKTRVALIRVHSAGGDTVAPENMAKFQEDLKKAMDQETEISGVLLFTEFDLNLGENAIPHAVLFSLSPLIKFEAFEPGGVS